MRTSEASTIPSRDLHTAVIVSALERYLRPSCIRSVYFAEDTIAPPVLAYVTHFPRLYVPLSGCHNMDIAQAGVARSIRPQRGQAVFVPANAWDKPQWSRPTRVLTFLFGAEHIGISLVERKGGAETRVQAIKTNIHGAYDALTHSILGALIVYASERSQGPLGNLLVESLLQACLRLLKTPEAQHSRKAVRTFELICLYVQENFQSALSRENIARHFGLAPNHVSRLFRQQGQVRFTDYLNLVRMNRAKFMLRNYNITLKEVTASCGYSDVTYFCRTFKRMNNETPTEYRSTQKVGSLAADGEAGKLLPDRALRARIDLA